eukprot:gene1447-1824_t
MQQQQQQLENNNISKNDVAIIGIGLRVPGGAKTPQELWNQLLSGFDGISQVPKDRWNPSFYQNEMIINKYGGFINDSEWKNWDPLFFGVSPKEAPHLDPQQRLLLSIVWEALEDACIPPSQLKGSNTVTGKVDKLELVAKDVTAAGIFHAFLRSPCSFHSSHQKSIKSNILKSLENMESYDKPTIPLFSTVHGRMVSEPMSALYTYQNLRKPVIFSHAIKNIYSYLASEKGDNSPIFVEIAPHPTLTHFLSKCSPNPSIKPSLSITALNRTKDECSTFLESVSTLYRHGISDVDFTCQMDLDDLECTGWKEMSNNLPRYQWETETYWNESLFSHCQRLDGPSTNLLATTDSFTWSKTSKGKVFIQPPTSSSSTSTLEDLTSLKKLCQITTIDRSDLYQKITKQGLQYGPFFQRVESVNIGDNCSFATLFTLPTDKTILNACLIDNCFHGLLVLLEDQQDFVVEKVSSLVLNYENIPIHSSTTKLYLFTQLKNRGSSTVEGSSKLMTSDGKVVVHVKSFTVKSLQKKKDHDLLKAPSKEIFYPEWQSKESPLTIPKSHTVCGNPLFSDSSILMDSDFSQYCANLVYESLITSNQSFTKDVLLQDPIVTMKNLNIDSSYLRFFSRIMDIFKQYIVNAKYPPPTKESIQSRYSNSSIEMEVIEKVSKVIPKLLFENDKTSSHSLFENNLLESFYSKSGSTSFYLDETASIVQKAVQTLSSKKEHRVFKILEIGAGTGSLTHKVLEKIQSVLPTDNQNFVIEYTFTDISSNFMQPVKNLLIETYPNITFKFGTLNLEKDIKRQGFMSNSYDIILMAYVIHAVSNIEFSVGQLYDALTPNGWLLYIEPKNHIVFPDLVFGCFEQWWHFSDSIRVNHCSISTLEWQSILTASGFSHTGFISGPEEQSHSFLVHSQKERISSMPMLGRDQQSSTNNKIHKIVLFLLKNPIAQNGSSPVNKKIQKYICEVSIFCHEIEIIESSELDTNFNEAKIINKIQGANHIFFLPGLETLNGNYKSITYQLVKLIQTLSKLPQAPGLSVVTKSALKPARNYLGSSLIGVFRTAFNEYPKLSITGFDIEDEETAPLSLMLKLAHNDLSDREFIIKREIPFVCRFFKGNHLFQQSNAFENDKSNLYCKTSSDLSFNCHIKESIIEDLIEIKVMAVGINFKDNLFYKGLLPQEIFRKGDIYNPPYGLECSGIITAVGPNVKNLKVGDAVVGYARHCLGSHVVTKQDLVMKNPHSRGNIYCTVGSKEKEDYLEKTYGPIIQNIYSTRNKDYSETLSSRGVDVVLNTLSGDYTSSNFRVLKAFGRLLDLSVTHIYANDSIELGNFKRDVIYSAIDLERVIDEKPKLLNRILSDIMNWINQGKLKLIPITSYPVTNTKEAIESLNNRTHIGKIVIDCSSIEKDFLTPLLSKPMVAKKNYRLNLNGNVLITGQAGISTQLINWISNHSNVSKIVVVSKSPMKWKLESLIKKNSDKVKIEFVQADVSNIDQLTNAIKNLNIPITSVFHLAANYNDVEFGKVDLDNISSVHDPKVLGALNLHRISIILGWKLSHFVLFSSITGVTGYNDQCSYNSANCTLDALANFRKQAGLPATVINWGPLQGEGKVSDNEAIQSLFLNRGLPSLSLKKFLAVFEGVLSTNNNNFTQIIASPINFSPYLDSFPHLKPKMDHLNNNSTDEQITSSKEEKVEIKDEKSSTSSVVYNLESLFELPKGTPEPIPASPLIPTIPRPHHSLPDPSILTPPTSLRSSYKNRRGSINSVSLLSPISSPTNYHSPRSPFVNHHIRPSSNDTSPVKPSSAFSSPISSLFSTPYSNKNPYILGMGTAVPNEPLPQDELSNVMSKDFSDNPEVVEKVKKIFSQSHIKTRHLLRNPLDPKTSLKLRKNETISDVNKQFIEHAPKLSKQACLGALKDWGGDPQDITHIVSVSSTGVVVPDINFLLIEELGLNLDVERVSVNFMGCLAGLSSMRVAAALASAHPKNRVLVVCTEICSTHFCTTEGADQIVAASIFADGSAAYVIGSNPNIHERPLYEVIHSMNRAVPKSAHTMTWEISTTGWDLGLDQSIPHHIGGGIEPFIEKLLSRVQSQTSKLSVKECEFLIHTGGKSIIMNIENSLGIDSKQTRHSWDIYKTYGNMSSASVLFVMDHARHSKDLPQYSIALAFGPGLAFEVKLSLVCKLWATKIIPTIELPFIIYIDQDDSSFKLFNRWSMNGILENQSFPKLSLVPILLDPFLTDEVPIDSEIWKSTHLMNTVKYANISNLYSSLIPSIPNLLHVEINESTDGDRSNDLQLLIDQHPTLQSASLVFEIPPSLLKPCSRITSLTIHMTDDIVLEYLKMDKVLKTLVVLTDQIEIALQNLTNHPTITNLELIGYSCNKSTIQRFIDANKILKKLVLSTAYIQENEPDIGFHNSTITKLYSNVQIIPYDVSSSWSLPSLKVLTIGTTVTPECIENCLEKLPKLKKLVCHYLSNSHQIFGHIAQHPNRGNLTKLTMLFPVKNWKDYLFANLLILHNLERISLTNPSESFVIQLLKSTLVKESLPKFKKLMISDFNYSLEEITPSICSNSTLKSLIIESNPQSLFLSIKSDCTRTLITRSITSIMESNRSLKHFEYTGFNRDYEVHETMDPLPSELVLPDFLCHCHGTGTLLFEKSWVSSSHMVGKGNMFSSLLTTVQEFSKQSTGMFVSYIEFGESSITIVYDEKTLLRCCLFHDVADGPEFGKLIANQLLRGFIEMYSDTDFLHSVHNVSKFSSFSNKIYDAISNSPKAIVLQLRSNRGIQNSIAVYNDGKSVTSGGGTEDQLGMIANLQAMLSFSNDILLSKGDRPKEVILDMVNNTVIVSRAGQVSLVCICKKNKEPSIYRKAIDDAVVLLDKVFLLLSYLQGSFVR